VLSPHSGHIDRIKKPPRYRDFGVPEYWVADQVARAIEVYRLALGSVEPEVQREVVRWRPVSAGPELTLEVAKLFD